MGGKFSYSYLDSSSSSSTFLIPQYGSFDGTPFTRNAVTRSFQATVDQQIALIPYLGYSFEKSFIYFGGGPTLTRVKTEVNDLVGFADINGVRTDISGPAQSFSSSEWVYGGAITMGTTYFLDQSWFVDINYTFSATQNSTANYYSTFDHVDGSTTYKGELIGSSEGSTTTQSVGVSINKAF
jgi:opacity protein-like surface antigen